MGNVSHLVTRTAAFESSVENGLAEGTSSKDRQFVTALARGLDILRAFHAGEGMLGNQEIAHRTGLPKPTVARLTHTLTELGYLNYIRRFRKYELGASVLALGYAGWGAGQLENEILRNDWLVADAAPDLIFDPADAGKWARALRQLGIDPVTLSPVPGRA